MKTTKTMCAAIMAALLVGAPAAHDEPGGRRAGSADCPMMRGASAHDEMRAMMKDMDSMMGKKAERGHEGPPGDERDSHH